MTGSKRVITNRSRGLGRLHSTYWFLRLALLLCLAVTAATVVQSNMLEEAVQDNLLRLRLERVVHQIPVPADAKLLGFLRGLGFSTQNPRVAWLAGYYVLSQTRSYAAASRFWAMAPAYSAEMLVLYSRTAADKTEALMAATAASELAPSALTTQRALADALIANAQWQEASHQLDRLLSVLPDNADLYAKRGLVEYQGGGSPERALELLSHAQELDPSNRLAPGYLINFYQTYRDPDELEALLIQLLTNNSTPALNAGFYASLAELYIRQGDLPVALPPLNSALALDPQSAWINSIAGGYYYRQQLYEQAAMHYEVAADEYDDPLIWVRLGDSYAELEHYAQAMEAYCTALEHDKTNTDIIDLLSELGASCE